MNISEVKEKVGISQFQLNVSTDASGEPTVDKETGVIGGWLRHWDNDNRVAVSIAKELMLEIKEDPTIGTLGIQKEIRSAELGDYVAYRIVKYKAAEFTL